MEMECPECAICLLKIEEGEGTTLPCNHLFHSICLSEGFQFEHKSCGLCKREIPNEIVESLQKNEEKNEKEKEEEEDDEWELWDSFNITEFMDDDEELLIVDFDRIINIMFNFDDNDSSSDE